MPLFDYLTSEPDNSILIIVSSGTLLSNWNVKWRH